MPEKITKVVATPKGRAMRPLKRKKKGEEDVPIKRTRKVVTWDVRTAIIYAFLHPQIYDADRSRISTCAKVIGVKRQTVHGWLNTEKNNPHVARWFDTVRELTWRSVRKRLGKAFAEKFDHIELDSKVPEEKLVPFAKARGDGPQVLTSVTPIPNATRGQLAKNDPEHYISIPAGRKHFICSGGGAKARGRKFQEEEAFLRNYIRQSWDQGAPRSMPEMKAELWAQYGDSTHLDFWKAYLDPEKKSADMQLGAFVRRVLGRMNINIRSLPRRRRSRRAGGPGPQQAQAVAAAHRP